MKTTINTLICVLAVTHSHSVWPSDACSTRAISTTADVTVSDGSDFNTASYFRSKDAAAITHVFDDEQTIAVEGPLSWIRRGDGSNLGEDFHKSFALGHQYHALMLHFADIVDDPVQVKGLSFLGAEHAAVSGDFPYGGAVSLVHSDDSERPAGLLFRFPGDTTITAVFRDWRQLDDVMLPYHVQIDDGEQVFDYRYSEVSIAPRTPLWFFDAVPAPELDSVSLYRLHRKLLAAHCLGDANLISELSAQEVLDVSHGEIKQSSNNELLSMFESLFERLSYTEYHDVEMPIIDVSQSADLAWIGANVRPTVIDRESGDSFSSQWAWIMLAKKIDGTWRNVGTASNRAL